MPDSALLFIHCLTGLHPGSGTALGVVDLPVQRERHTRWPIVPGSSLKGVLEDSLLRGYRVLELVGQFRLFDRRIDSGSIDPEVPAVVALRERLGTSSDFGIDPKSKRLTAPRELAARLLNELGDPVGRQLLGFDGSGDRIRARTRNHSILIHGFEASAPSDAPSLEALYDDLERLLCAAAPEAEEMLLQAKRLSFDG